MKKGDRVVWSHTVLRVFLGLIMAVAGYNKLMNPDGVSGMLQGIGFFAPMFFAWVLLLSELVFGVLVVVGYKVRYTAWPLAFILLVAWATVVVENSGFLSSNSLFHLIAVTALVMIAFSGPGKLALTRS
ncbi:MAG: DoxX family protein [Nanoarchaeota archaeon]|nr:DoxX family protein [Nanoarchaeota archaeon]